MLVVWGEKEALGVFVRTTPTATLFQSGALATSPFGGLATLLRENSRIRSFSGTSDKFYSVTLLVHGLVLKESPGRKPVA
jgi:hypothetical protein